MASQSSSNTSTSQHQDVNKQNQHPNSESNKIDFVKLSKDDLVRGSKVQEHNFLNPIQVGSSSSFPNNNNEGKDENNNEKKTSDSKFYSCNYCKGQYSSLQALGGHQNAHKAERAIQMKLIKQRYEGSSSDLGQPRFNPYLNYPITPFTTYNYRPLGGPLGVRMDSMIQKSPYFSPRPFGYGGLRLHDIFNPSLLSMRNNSGAASLGIGGATTSRIEDQVGTSNRNDAILRIGESSTNIVAPTNIVANIVEEPSDDSESSGLDLSLKL
ncbi:hypothetical protein TSUD_172350 [Trifolium subterraneum]|uniref:C2H2-type domain-containing protein n=1 Tax=Trifolium subterraneum TaxID=3900 RepID=A0A2Z6N2C2_TRISU|nr:hypothetical protein TSUD_172350 [Trifolium subterraneum]